MQKHVHLDLFNKSSFIKSTFLFNKRAVTLMNKNVDVHVWVNVLRGSLPYTTNSNIKDSIWLIRDDSVPVDKTGFTVMIKKQKKFVLSGTFGICFPTFDLKKVLFSEICFICTIWTLYIALCIHYVLFTMLLEYTILKFFYNFIYNSVSISK